MSAYRPHLPVELFQVFSVYHIASNSPHSPPPRDIPALCTRHERLARACFRSPLPAFALSVYAFYLHVPWNSIRTTGHLLTRPTWRGRAPAHAADGHCQRAAFPLWVRAPASHQPVSTEGPGLRGAVRAPDAVGAALVPNRLGRSVLEKRHRLLSGLLPTRRGPVPVAAPLSAWKAFSVTGSDQGDDASWYSFLRLALAELLGSVDLQASPSLEMFLPLISQIFFLNPPSYRNVTSPMPQSGFLPLSPVGIPLRDSFHRHAFKFTNLFYDVLSAFIPSNTF